jgi:hypothetical protein
MAELGNYKIPAAEDCLGYSNLACIEIRLDSMESFIKRVRTDKPVDLWSCYAPICDKFAPSIESNSKYDVEPENIFFYVNGNSIISASSEGFETIADYLDAVKLGFYGKNRSKLFEVMRTFNRNISVAYLYRSSKKYGYPDAGIFLKYCEFYGKSVRYEFVGYKEKKKEFKEAQNLGYHKIEDFMGGKVAGFTNGRDYYEAKYLEIEFKCDYDDYKVLSEQCEKYGFKKRYEAHIFHILSRYRGGKGINLKEVLTKWKSESFYYIGEWYGIDEINKTEQKLREILSTGKKFGETGKIVGDPPEFVLYRNDTIYVDGSNVAWNDSEDKKGDFPHALNIKIATESLKSMGFRNVVVLCDNNLFDSVDDKEIYKELKENKVLEQVRRGKIADEWLIRFRKNKDAFIVSNDKFREYLMEDPDLKDHIIEFKVAGGEVSFDDPIYKVVDGINLDGEMPHLCRAQNGSL